MYNNLKNYFTKGRDQFFCDNLSKVLVVEIKLKSGNINENLLLQCDEVTNHIYGGERYKSVKSIKKGVSAKALTELQTLVAEGSKLNFENDAQIKNWVILQTGILSGTFS